MKKSPWSNTIMYTPKQKRFVTELVANGGNATRAAMEVYDTEDNATARAIGYENLTKPHIQRELAVALKESDVTLKRACKAIGDGLGSDKENVRLQAAGMTLKLYDAYPRRRVTDHRHAHLHLAVPKGLEELSDDELEGVIETAQRQGR